MPRLVELMEQSGERHSLLPMALQCSGMTDVTIDGVGKFALPLPAVNLPVVLRSWEQMKGLIDGTNNRGLPENTGKGLKQPPTRGPKSGHGGGGGTTTTGGGGRSPTGVSEDEPEDLQLQPDGTPNNTGDDTESADGRVRPKRPGNGGPDSGAGGLPEKHPQSGVKVSDEEISNTIIDEINALFGDEDTGPKASNVEETGHELPEPPKQEPPKGQRRNLREG